MPPPAGPHAQSARTHPVPCLGYTAPTPTPSACPNLQHTPARHGGVMALRSAAGSRANEAKRVNAELFTFTYGSLVAQLLKDYEDDADVNTQLEKMGYNIGCRLIEDFLARSGVGKCSDFRETADVIAKLGFKMFLGMQPAVTQWSADGREFTLVLDDNPFIEYVELPPEHKDLLYCNLICGVLRGALEMVQMKVEVGFVKDVLRGDESSEVRVRLVEMLEDGAHHQD
eukprot:comp23118_c0_seq1/m.37232 comp23118_c0_seq1/g.37232  ORF comp23118_c0_seq1/g.37232 comp23118_c0_seq1/m.37232 type:complete len:228 (-) comp23118_c0_seq1:289-972(-)